MKVLKLLLLILSTITLSCTSAEKLMQKRLDKVYIGMPLKEFREQIKNTTLVYLGDDYTCYKLEKRRAKYGEGFTYSTRFFYFLDGKLWKLNEGERSVDYRIKFHD